jgi:CHAD domain-containing protein
MATRALVDDRSMRLRLTDARAAVLPSLEPIEVRVDATLATLVTAGLTGGTRRFVEHESTIRGDADPEGVHQARVGIRRVRSLFRAFEGVLDPAWTASFDDELSRVADVLGVVRDADVLGAHLVSCVGQLEVGDQEAGASLLTRAAQERARAMKVLVGELDSTRYHDLVVRLTAEVGEPHLRHGADRRARKAAPDIVGRPWKKLQREVDGLPDDPAPADLHRVRIRAKRVRYAAAAFVPVLGTSAKQLTKPVARLQGTLGDLNDHALAEQWLRRVVTAPGISRATALVAGVLVAREQDAAAAAMACWPQRWSEVRAAAKHSSLLP